MERYKKADTYPIVNPVWDRKEVRDMVGRHKKESFGAGIYDSFANSMLSNLDTLRGHIGIRQVDMSEHIALIDAPMVVLTDYDDVSDSLYIHLAKIDVRNGWIISAAERNCVDTSTVCIGAVFPDGNIEVNQFFSEEQFKILENQKADYASLGFNFAVARRRHIDNHMAGY